ncbi:hypothetical protein QOT17_010500 [Balamuthia mandrillaris]
MEGKGLRSSSWMFLYAAVVGAVAFAATLGHLVVFFQPAESSSIRSTQSLRDFREAPWSNKVDVLLDLLTDAALIGLFVLQHRFLTAVHKRWQKHGLHPNLARSLYVLATCCCFELMIAFWRVLPSLQQNGWWWHEAYLWSTLYYAGWILAALQTFFLLDPLNFIGFQQDKQQERGLERLFQHMRHPLCTAVLLILWSRGLWTLDRLMLSSCLTAYLFLGHRLDEQDLSFVS